MLTSAICFSKYGPPERESSLVMWDVPSHLEIGAIPKRLYCNKDMVGPLGEAFMNLINRGVVHELMTWDGCFNIRAKRGQSSMSLHSWGVAVDVNAAWNRLGHKPRLSTEFVACFTDAGFDWGGYWGNPDGMHFQLKELP